jgi:dihydroorotate dehydrogenase electron transfer subunit
VSKAHRASIFLEDAAVVSQTAFVGDQFILRLHAPQCAARASPGTFIHIRCEPEIPMRRPLSIMRASAEQGWIEVLYKIVGEGLRVLGRAQPGDYLNLLGPIGQGFRPDPARPIALMLGGGVGIPPLIFLTEHLHRAAPAIWQPIAFFGSELPFPFEIRPDPQPLIGAPPTASAALALLEDWGIPSRLASKSCLPGCHDGFVTDLARAWLHAAGPAERERAGVYACGPEPMLRAAQELAGEFALPSQLCLEEFMACAVGGCAGCAVAVHTRAGIAMRRVCVDGPVFPGEMIYPPSAA